MKPFVIAALLASSAIPAIAQGRACAPRENVIERLTSQYGETRQMAALDNNQALTEVWANLATGSWTFTVTTPQGMTCLTASGQAFEAYAEPPGIDG